MTSINYNIRRIILNKGILYACAVSFIYGVSFIFTKTATENYPPFTVLAWRFTFAFFMMAIAVSLGFLKVNFKNKNIFKFLPLALMFPGLYYALETYGIRLATAAEAGLITSTGPILTLLFTFLIIKEKPTRHQFFGIILTFIGIIISILSGRISPTFSPLGYSLLFIGIFSYTIYAVLLFKEKNFSASEKTLMSMGLGSISYLIIGFIEAFRTENIESFIKAPLDISFLGSVLFLSFFCSVVAFFLNVESLRLLGTNKKASFGGLTTFFSILSGILILGEPFNLGQVFAAVLIILGIIVANRPQRIQLKAGKLS